MQANKVLKYDRALPTCKSNRLETKDQYGKLQTKPYKDAHFATFPMDLIEPCVLAGCPRDGLVLDPFAGSGTTGQAALANNRKAVLIELNAEYVKLIKKRFGIGTSLFDESADILEMN